MTDYPQHFFEDLSDGMSASLSKEINRDQVAVFADVTGDTNPLHLDEDYAAGTLFKGCIAHGMFSAGLISAVFGTTFPGPGCIYVSQELKFKAPVRIGDTLTATVTVLEKFDKGRRVRFDTTCTVGDTVVVDGEAVLVVPGRLA